MCQQLQRSYLLGSTTVLQRNHITDVNVAYKELFNQDISTYAKTCLFCDLIIDLYSP